MVSRSLPHALLAAAKRFAATAIVPALCLAALSVYPSSAHAATAPDFDGDGVPDQIVLPSPPETNIIVRLSTRRAQVLKLSGRVLSVVAADVDHDGDLDLSALSERRGVLVWLNQGGPGRFSRLKKKPAPRGYEFSGRAQTTGETPDNDSVVAPRVERRVELTHAPRADLFTDPLSGGEPLPHRPRESALDCAGTLPSRGPPSA
jgi:hypothetical protein